MNTITSKMNEVGSSYDLLIAKQILVAAHKRGTIDYTSFTRGELFLQRAQNLQDMCVASARRNIVLAPVSKGESLKSNIKGLGWIDLALWSVPAIAFTIAYLNH